MSAFHPALTGILYSALAQHEQALIQMALAANIAQADVDPEIAERYGAIVDGLKKTIAMCEPTHVGGPSGIESAETMRRAIALADRISSEIAEVKIWSWDINGTPAVRAHLSYSHGSSAADMRAAIRSIADRLQLEYIERRHGKTGQTLHTAAAGEIDGIEVEVYRLVEAERPFCDMHDVMLDDAGACQQCGDPDTVDDPLPETEA